MRREEEQPRRVGSWAESRVINVEAACGQQANGAALLVRMGGGRPIDVKVPRCIRRASAVPMDPSSMRPALPAGGSFENLAGFGNWDHVPRAPRPPVRGFSGKDTK